MFDCDFSNLKSLRRITLTSTPLQADSLHTLPNTVEHIEISQMDALVHSDLVKFLKSHVNLKTLKLSRCRHINKQFAELLTLVPALRSLELIGPGIDDKGLKELFDMPRALKLLRLHHTQISDETLESLANGCLNIEHLDISHNSQISQLGITRLLKQKETNRITRVGIVA
jgi:hypothetical protein